MLFDTLQQQDQMSRDPRFGRGNLFFKGNGEATFLGTFGNIASHALGGPMLGSLFQQGFNQLAMNGLEGKDTIANAQKSTDKMIQNGQMVDSIIKPIVETAVNVFAPGAGAMAKMANGGASSAAKKFVKSPPPILATPSVLPPLPAADNAVQTTIPLNPIWNMGSGMANPYQQPLFFASGGFALKFAEERKKQGAGGIFNYNGKAYTTNFKEEEKPQNSGVLPRFSGNINDLNIPGIKERIGAVESNNNYNAVNPNTGALGKYQFLPGTLRDYGVRPAEFLKNPALQERVMETHIQRKLPAAMAMFSRYGGMNNLSPVDYILGIHFKGQRGFERELKNGSLNKATNINPSTNEYIARSYQRTADAGDTMEFKFGGLAFRVQKPADYTIYPKGSKKEDLTMIDESTGKLFGRMRIGEYIMPQDKSLAAGAVMEMDIPRSEKVNALGHMMYQQLEEKPLGLPIQVFADGGLPKRKPQAYGDLVLKQFKEHNERIVDYWEKESQKTAFTDKQRARIAEAKRMVSTAKENLAAIGRGEIGYSTTDYDNLDGLKNFKTGRFFNFKKFRESGAYDDERGFHTLNTFTVGDQNAYAGSFDLGSSAKAAATDIGKKANAAGLQTTYSAAMNKPDTTKPAQTDGSSVPGPTIPPAGSAPLNTNPSGSGRGRQPGPAMPAATGSYTIQPGDTLVKISQKTGVPLIDLANWNGIANFNKIDAGQTLSLTPPAMGSLGVKDNGNLKPVGITNNLKDALTTRGPQIAGQVPAANAPAPQTGNETNVSWQQMMGLGMDLGKMLYGATLASRPINEPTIPQRWLNYVGEVSERKNTGLNPQQMALGSNMIANNYRQGVNSLTMAAGGGANPGTVLAGLSNLGLQRGQQTQNLLAMDAAARQQNFAQYGQVTGQTSAMEQALEQDKIGRQMENRQVGMGLVSSGMQNITSAATYYQNQPLWNKVMQSQVDREQEATDALKAMRTYYSNAVAPK
nr:LysM peptidoglycan-binding domain-containing protein [uncultured Arsenicibacter sp.]